MLADPGPELMFDDRVYKRGALTLHALRLTVGDDAFFSLLKDWVAEHSGGSVTTEDFRAFAGEPHRGRPGRAVRRVAHADGAAGAASRRLSSLRPAGRARAAQRGGRSPL